jgi:ABC-type multidrug transport system permease subunit
LTSPPRLPRPAVVTAFARRDRQTSTSYRAALVVDLVLSALALLIYYYISQLFSRPTLSLQGAPTYFSFVAVGLSLAVIVQAGSVGLVSTLRNEQFTGTLEALCAKPVSSAELALGLALYPFLFALARAVVYLAIAGLLLGADFSEMSPVGFVVGLVLTGLALMSVGIALAAFVFVVKRGEAVSGVVVTALVLLGGAYFPVSIFPSAVEAMAKAVPTRFAFEGVRAALFNGDGWVEPMLKLAAFGAVSLPIAVFVFDRALRFAKQRGTLGQY